jgi:hypothetical protein
MKDAFRSDELTGASPFSRAIRDMQEYFQRNGYYRAADLEMVLGDPRSHFSVEAISIATANQSRKGK